jgi:hypothetical protein
VAAEAAEVSDGREPGSAEREVREGLPWYRHFYVWLIIGLLGTAVTASLWTVGIAFENADSLVRDDWYADGAQINRRLEKEETARRLGIRAGLHVDVETGEVWLDLMGDGSDGVDALRLELSHPTQSQKDRVLALQRDPSGRFRGQLERRIAGRWYAILSPASGGEEDWRVTRTVRFPNEGTIELGAGT